MDTTSTTEKIQLHASSLEELQHVLQTGLKSNFAEVEVSVVDCPDLTKEPFTFPVPGPFPTSLLHNYITQ
uniref:DUF1907 domain-containing protein n=1 Tax=Gouania willdenowi TaxID=441366 RepID=A0A8C5EG58_GOUWI